jgi:hypothetical protein
LTLFLRDTFLSVPSPLFPKICDTAGRVIDRKKVHSQIASQAAHHEEEPANTRAITKVIEAEVVGVDTATGQVRLKGPLGNVLTLTIPADVSKLENVKVGDTVVTTYMAAMELELREPTAEELAEPWVVVEKSGAMPDPENPGIGGARVIRAVCTIEGMNRVLGTVTLKDSNGKLHLIGEVEPEKMEGVVLGQTVVVLYAEAVALTLVKKESQAQ